jgi:hypothetical protein
MSLNSLKEIEEFENRLKKIGIEEKKDEEYGLEKPKITGRTFSEDIEQLNKLVIYIYLQLLVYT